MALSWRAKGRRDIRATPDKTWKDFGKEGDAGNTFLAYYLGDKYVDIIGLDDYTNGHSEGEADFWTCLKRVATADGIDCAFVN